MAGGREAGDLADLGDDQHRRVAPDTADLGEHVDAVIGLGALLDLGRGLLDLAVEVADQRDQAVQSPSRRVAQLERDEEFAAAFAKQVGVLSGDAVLGEDRVHAVLDRRAHPGQRRAVAKQLTQITQLARRDVRLGQKPSAQQVRKRLGVDRVCLHPGRGNRPGAERVREVQVIAGFLEQLREPLPAVGRLQRHVRPIRVAYRSGRTTTSIWSEAVAATSWPLARRPAARFQRGAGRAGGLRPARCRLAG
jgi:hypothetical protein